MRVDLLALPALTLCSEYSGLDSLCQSGVSRASDEE